MAEMTRKRDRVRTVTDSKGKASAMRMVETVTREDEVRLTPKKKEYQDLCTSCKNASTCTYPRDPGRAMLQCQEYE